MGFRNNGSGGQDGAGRQGKDAYTHLWRTPGGDFPCTPTGVEKSDESVESGRVYAQVRTPEGDENYVPKDELILRPTKAARGLSASEHARLDSYILTIAGEARGTPVSDSSGGWRFGGRGALRSALSGCGGESSAPCPSDRKREPPSVAARRLS
jgi:hypothetical protein